MVVSNCLQQFLLADSADAQKVKIEQTAQAILDARALYPDSSPAELPKAHQANDCAVMTITNS